MREKFLHVLICLPDIVLVTSLCKSEFPSDILFLPKEFPLKVLIVQLADIEFSLLLLLEKRFDFIFIF